MYYHVLGRNHRLELRPKDSAKEQRERGIEKQA